MSCPWTVSQMRWQGNGEPLGSDPNHRGLGGCSKGEALQLSVQEFLPDE